MILIVIEEYMEIKDPLKEEYTKVRMGGHQIEEAIRIEDTLGEIIQIEMGDPMEEEDPLMMEDPLIMEEPLMMEDPLMTEDPLTMEDPEDMDNILDTLEDKDHQVPKDLLDQ